MKPTVSFLLLAWCIGWSAFIAIDWLIRGATTPAAAFYCGIHAGLIPFWFLEWWNEDRRSKSGRY